MTAKEIIKKYLEENGYDGLSCEDCGCSKDDLMPCCGLYYNCAPAYKVNCNRECGEYDVCYSPVKSDKCIHEDE